MPDSDPVWKKPATRAEQARVVKRLRDGLLHKFMFSLDRTVPYAIGFDEEGDKDHSPPVHVLWHTVETRGVSWSKEYGCIGTGCLVQFRQTDQVGIETMLDGAMLQVGGVIIPAKDHALVNKRYPIIKSHRGILVYLETKYFLTAQALKLFYKGITPDEHNLRPESYIKDGRATWHVVPEWVWRTIVSRMVRSLAPSKDLVRRLRTQELRKLDEGMDPSRLTQDDRDK